MRTTTHRRTTMTTNEIISDNELVTIIDGGGLSADATKKIIREAFAPLVQSAGDLVREAEGISVTAADQLTEMAEARRVRLALVKVRTGAAKTRDTLKADALATSRVLDACNRWVADRCAPVEARLQDAELFAERAERARKDALRDERAALLRPFGLDPSLYALDVMKPEAFDDLLNGARLAHEAKITKAAQDEADRVARQKADDDERARVRAENERLRAEATEREAQAVIERAARIRAERESEAKARKDREAIEAAARAEREAAEEVANKERQRLHAVAVVERQKREAVEKVERDRLAAEAKQKAADAKAANKAAAAPDREKLLALANQFAAIQLPTMSTDEGAKAIRTIKSALAAVVEAIRGQAEQIGGGA
jgi:hypothetical protein